MKKLLFVLNSYPAFGGIETVTGNLSSFFCKEYCVYTLAVFQNPEAPLSQGVTHSYHFPGLDFQPNCAYFNALVEELSIDLVINQGMSSYLTEIVFNADRNTQVKVISVHHGLPGYEKWQYWLQEPMAKAPSYKRLKHKLLASIGLNMKYRSYLREFRKTCRKCAELSDKVVFLADGFIDLFIKEYSVARYRQKMVAIPNPLSEAYSRLDNPDWSLKRNEVVYVGRLSEEKRLDLLMDVWKKTPHEGWKLLLVGDGPMRHALEDKAQAIGQVRMVGYQADPSVYYQQAKIIILTSAFEGFGMCLVEGMSYGAYPVSFDVWHGVESVLSHGAGMVVPNGDIHAMAEQLAKLIGQENRLQPLSQEAFEHSRKYTLSTVGAQWITLFHELFSE